MTRIFTGRESRTCRSCWKWQAAAQKSQPAGTEAGFLLCCLLRNYSALRRFDRRSQIIVERCLAADDRGPRHFNAVATTLLHHLDAVGRNRDRVGLVALHELTLDCLVELGC